VPRRRIARQSGQGLADLGGIDPDDRQDRAKLNHHLEGLAGTLETQKMPRQQDMPGRGHRNELGQPFEKAKQQRRKRGVGHHRTPWINTPDASRQR